MHACHGDDQGCRAGPPMSSRVRPHATLVAAISRLDMAAVTIVHVQCLGMASARSVTVVSIRKIVLTITPAAGAPYYITVGQNLGSLLSAGIAHPAPQDSPLPWSSWGAEPQAEKRCARKSFKLMSCNPSLRSNWVACSSPADQHPLVSYAKTAIAWFC